MDLVGSTVRSIRLLQRLGQGGMGEVYLGVDERLGRKVAVKAIRSERRLDSRTRARFLREARVLSQLDHANICRLHDYLETDGSEFIVLELIEGRTLRELLSDQLTYGERLDIASQTAAGLAAAHAMSIIHRDLKPENIMRTPEGLVKVLDFGLARPVSSRTQQGEREPRAQIPALRPDAALSQAETATSISMSATPEIATLTRHGRVVGTPRYLSPEQARGERLTPASDLYSFGLILQELFTSRPALPQTKNTTELVQKAMWGDSEPVAGLDPDLVALIERLKALRPRDRPSAETTVERLRFIAGKPARRRRTLLRTAALVALALAAVVSTVGLVLARRGQQAAERSERRARAAQGEAEAVNSFLVEMVSSADPTRAGKDIKVVEILDRAAQTVESSFAEHPERRAAVLDALGRTYISLGDFPRAHEVLSRALALRRALSEPRSVMTLSTMHNMGYLLGEMGRSREAEALLRETLALRSEVLGPDHRHTLITLGALAINLDGQQRFEEAEPLYRRCYEGCLRTLGEKDISTLTAMSMLGDVLVRIGRLDEASTLVRGAYDRSLAQLGPKHYLTIDSQANLAYLLSRQTRPTEAVAQYRRLVATNTEMRGAEHPLTLELSRDLARNLNQLQQYAEAERILRAVIAAQGRTIGPANRDTIESVHVLVHNLREQGRVKEALRLTLERWQIARRILGPEDPLTLETKSGHAVQLMEAGKSLEAERLLREILAARRRAHAEASPQVQSSRALLATALRNSGRGQEAAKIEAGP